MNYVTTLFAFLLLLGSSFLTVYNIMYAYRINVAGKKIDIALPKLIKRIFGITVFLSFGATAIILIIFVASLFSLRLPQ